MTTLITGVGAVGAHVAAKLQSMNEELVLFDKAPNPAFLGTLLDLAGAALVVGDVNDRELLAATVREHKVERIVHLAGFLTKTLRQNPFGGVELNLLGTGSVLEVARVAGVRRVVFASTRGVNQIAAPPEGSVLTEDFQMRVLSDRPKTMYELTKLGGEHLGLLYSDLYDFEFVALRLGGGFGPTPGPPAGLTGTVIRPLVYGALAGQPVVISDPSLTYAGNHEFIYFRDDAEAFALACFRESLPQRVYNIRMEQTYEYAQVLDVVRSVFPSADIQVSTTNSESMTAGRAPRNDNADTTAARAELGWSPSYDLEAGIRDWAKWIEESGYPRGA